MELAASSLLMFTLQSRKNLCSLGSCFSIIRQQMWFLFHSPLNDSAEFWSWVRFHDIPMTPLYIESWPWRESLWLHCTSSAFSKAASEDPLAASMLSSSKPSWTASWTKKTNYKLVQNVQKNIRSSLTLTSLSMYLCILAFHHGCHE